MVADAFLWVLNRTPSLRRALWRAFFDLLALTPTSAINDGQFWQFFTYMFVHDTYNPMHLILNMFGLAMFGPRIEQKMGEKK